MPRPTWWVRRFQRRLGISGGGARQPQRGAQHRARRHEGRHRRPRPGPALAEAPNRGEVEAKSGFVVHDQVTALVEAPFVACARPLVEAPCVACARRPSRGAVYG